MFPPFPFAVYFLATSASSIFSPHILFPPLPSSCHFPRTNSCVVVLSLCTDQGHCIVTEKFALWSLRTIGLVWGGDGQRPIFSMWQKCCNSEKPLRPLAQTNVSRLGRCVFLVQGKNSPAWLGVSMLSFFDFNAWHLFQGGNRSLSSYGTTSYVCVYMYFSTETRQVLVNNTK